MKYGSLVDIRLATFRNGSSKGYAYIEFENANDASRALVATDGLEFHGSKISVAISEPPVRSGPSKSVSLTSNRKEQSLNSNPYVFIYFSLLFYYNKLNN